MGGHELEVGTIAGHSEDVVVGDFNAAFGGVVGKNLFDTVRVYVHSGYFTRGIYFASSALEITRFKRFTPVAFATYGILNSTQRNVAGPLRLNSSRPDLGGSLGLRLSKNWSAYGSVSRSLGRRDFNSVTVSVGGGISYTFRVWGHE